MVDLLNVARDIAKGCQYLEENQFIHRYLTDDHSFCMYMLAWAQTRDSAHSTVWT